jgi:glycosyltransferase involved in cell wall biosynthesis
MFFSIAIPTYGYNGRGRDFLDFSLNKIASQTFEDFEVVISDHSTDDTIKDLCDSRTDLPIKYFRNEIGRGIISPNINHAMKQCSGKWIKVLFQDDFLLDEKSLDIQFQFLSKHRTISWMMTAFYHSDDGINLQRPFLPSWNNKIWTGNNTMGCPSGMTVKNEDLIFFDESINFLMDCDYYYRMYLEHGPPAILLQFTTVNRTWGSRLTDTINQTIRDNELAEMIKKYA